MDNYSKGHHHIQWCSLRERHVRRICYPNIGSSLYKTMHHDAVNQLFKNKYGIDLKKIGFINVTRLDFEKK